MPTTFQLRIRGAIFLMIAAACMLAAMGRATIGLVVAMLAAFVVWARQPSRQVPPGHGLLATYALGWGVMCVHCAEEYLTGFPQQFPRWFGYEWTNGAFLTFNLVWLLIFGAAAFGLARSVPLALLVAWFFALGAGIVNGAGHLLLSLVLRRYFPGLLTAPFCLGFGLLLARQLSRCPIRPPTQRAAKVDPMVALRCE